MKQPDIIVLFKRILMLTAALLSGISHVYGQPDPDDYAEIIYVKGQNVQQVIDQAPPYSTIVGDDREYLIEDGKTIVIDKPLRLTNFRGRLAPGTRDTRILQIESEHVMVDNFRLYGNRESVDYSDRTSLLRILTGHFLIENGHLFDSMKHGIVVRSMEADTEHGIIRNIVTRNIRRDGISLTGYGDLGFFNRNILIENVTAYGSNDRGAVEVSDGNEQITLRNVYADHCRYGVEIQDHEREGQINRGIVIEGVDVTHTMSAVNFNLSDYGHGDITLRDIGGQSWPERDQDRFSDRSPVDIRNAARVIVENVQIRGNRDRPGISLRDSDGVMIRNVFIETRGNTGYPVIRAGDVSDLLIDGVNIRPGGKVPALISYRLSGEGDHRNVQIRGVSATREGSQGIILERDSPRVTLSRYIITNNLVPVTDRINGSSAVIKDNLP